MHSSFSLRSDSIQSSLLQTVKPVPALLETWFRNNQRPLPWRQHYDPWHVWVSEIMLQQTRMDVVLPYFVRFIERFPSVGALAAATAEEVTTLWSGLGYYRRARMLHEGARYVVAEFGGRIPSDVEALRSIPGIGRYTAGAIASTAFQQRTPIVDGNVMRVLARLFAIDDPLGSTALEKRIWTESATLVENSARPREFNQGLMELGATICTPRNPACVSCPISSACVAFRTGRVSELPQARAKKSAREMTIPLLVIRDARGRVMVIRAAGELMDAMFHLPHGTPDLIPSVQLDATRGNTLGRFTHTITTRRITFEVCEATLGTRLRDSAEARWITIDELALLPHPSYVRKAIAMATTASAQGRLLV